jgi:hypothetical protein
MAIISEGKIWVKVLFYDIFSREYKNTMSPYIALLS